MINWNSVYLIVIFSYIIYIYSLLCLSKEKKYNSYKGNFSVIIPCYNEEPEPLTDCLNSIIKAEGDKQIIVVDDGSTRKETIKVLDGFKDKLILLRQKNKGKRKAQVLGLKYATSEIIVFCDSDTVVKKDCFVELIKPFEDKEVALVSACILVLNKNQNILTKCINAMYWTASNIWRQSVGNQQYMQVTNGPCSAYRKEYLLKLKKEYINQKFMGSECRISDDRFLCLRIQTRYRKKVVYQKNAIAYAYSPSSIRGFFKQLIRWRKGLLRESFLLLREPNKKHNLLLVGDCYFNLLLAFTVIGVKLLILYSFIASGFNFNILFTFARNILIMSGFYSFFMLFYNPKEFPYKIIYSYLYELIFCWVVVPAVLTINNQKNWGTR